MEVAGIIFSRSAVKLAKLANQQTNYFCALPLKHPKI